MRFVLHSDLNNFYASVECLMRPEIRNKPVVVVGDEKKRHGIVLSKNQMAKAYHIRTGDEVWEVRQKVGKDLVCITANFDLYQAVSQQVKNIYRTYSDYVESFGIDEAWIDVSKIARNFAQAEEVAHLIRKEVLQKVGISVSIGVSFNKVFAKLGSDMKKPNAVTVITPENFKEKVWPLPVEDLLYVGHATKRAFEKAHINTIGDLANTELSYLKKVFGKNGVTLHTFANGADVGEVKKVMDPEKSFGNSTTCPRDLKTNEEVKAVLYILAENVMRRMRKRGWWCGEVSLYVKDDTLESNGWQKQLAYPTNLVKDVVCEAMKLFLQHYHWNHTVRAVGVRVSKLCTQPGQVNLFVNPMAMEKQLKVEQTVELLREKFYPNIIRRAVVAKDADFVELDVSSGGHGVMQKF